MQPQYLYYQYLNVYEMDFYYFVIMLPPNTSEYFIKMEKQNLNIFTVYIHVNVESMFN